MRRAGFTLTEVLLGVALLSSVFLALAAIYPVSLTSLRKSQHEVAASNIARKTLEEWRQQPFDTIKAAQQSPPPNTTVSLDGESYTVIVGISDLDPVDPDVKQIDVQVLTAQDSRDQIQVEDTTCVFNFANPI